ncbi:hypothetical protein T484DRAFT_1775433 [Baffinella frigidus]|nr:hypothetical protein T484DRAFT_1775433 [Cryptophyta sp. CCMP2293]
MGSSTLLIALAAAFIASALAETYSAGGTIVSICRSGQAGENITMEVTNKNSAAATAYSTPYIWEGFSEKGRPSTAIDRTGKKFAFAGHGTSGPKVNPDQLF